MAEVRRNTLLEGLSGRVGDVVFRIRDGRTFVARRPVRCAAATATGARGETLSRFKQAVAFAREARHKPAFRSLSRMLRGYSPYHLAIQDYLSEPVIERVDASAVGAAGGLLVVEVSEKIEVRSVEIQLLEGGVDAATGGDATSQGDLPLGGENTHAIVLRAERVSGARRVVPGALSRPARESVPSSPAPPPAPPSTPAEIFFRRPSATTTPEAEAGERAATNPRESTPSPRREEFEASGAGSEDETGEGSSKVTWTIWRLTVPHPGEIEVRAFDYAGNVATHRRWVGPGCVPLFVNP
jgi:hypothetical protein